MLKYYRVKLYIHNAFNMEHEWTNSLKITAWESMQHREKHRTYKQELNKPLGGGGVVVFLADEIAQKKKPWTSKSNGKEAHKKG